MYCAQVLGQPEQTGAACGSLMQSLGSQGTAREQPGTSWGSLGAAREQPGKPGGSQGQPGSSQGAAKEQPGAAWGSQRQPRRPKGGFPLIFIDFHGFLVFLSQHGGAQSFSP